MKKKNVGYEGSSKNQIEKPFVHLGDIAEYFGVTERTLRNTLNKYAKGWTLQGFRVGHPLFFERETLLKLVIEAGKKKELARKERGKKKKPSDDEDSPD